jgi:DNA-binding GntR family transcriptional regulator
MYERKLLAGAFVSQSLVESTGVPIAPLRDALRTLEAEGVLTIHPHAGIQFIKPGWNWRAQPISSAVSSKRPL